MQGGPGFPVLADPVLSYLSTNQCTHLQIDEEDLPPMLSNVFQQVLYNICVACNRNFGVHMIDP